MKLGDSTRSTRILHAGAHPTRTMKWCAAIYVTVSVALTASFLLLNANLAKRTGVNRVMYPESGFTSAPLFADVSQDITLDFLNEIPGLPRRFFSVRWEGYWYVPETRPFTLHGAGDDRLDVWVDGELVIRRQSPTDMHTETRTKVMEAGLHELRVEYQQHRGDRNLRFEWFPGGGPLRWASSARLFHDLPDAHAIQLARNVDRLRLAAIVSWILPLLSGAVFVLTRRLLEVAKRAAVRLHYERTDLAALVVLMAVALPVAIATGSRYDYPYYESHWGLILIGADPWATNNAYGPVYNLLAGAFVLHPLLPKVIFVLGWLACCSYLLRELANSGVGKSELLAWSTALPLNPLFWVFIVVYGVFDALVATFCILALALLQADRRALAGFMFGVAVLLKFYPIVMAPFIATRGRQLDVRFATSLAGTLAIGFTLSVLVWGNSTFDPIVEATSYHSNTLSVFRFLEGEASPFTRWTGNESHVSVPAMALAGAIVLMLFWRWRLSLEAGALVSILVTLSLYSAASIQYFMVVPFLSAYWYAHRHPTVARDATLIISLAACLTWLAFLAVLYELTRPTGERFGMNGEWEFLRDWVGLPTFAMFLWLIVALMRYERRNAAPRRCTTHNGGRARSIGRR